MSKLAGDCIALSVISGFSGRPRWSVVAFMWRLVTGIAENIRDEDSMTTTSTSGKATEAGMPNHMAGYNTAAPITAVSHPALKRI